MTINHNSQLFILFFISLSFINMNNTKFLIIIIFILIYFDSSVNCQPNLPLKEIDLYNKIAYLDSSLFATAYTCNTLKNSTFFTEDLEFYHDKSGLLADSRKAFLESMEKRFCGEQNGFKLRRELVPGTMKVYPLKDYGAVQTGEHRFYQTSKGQKEKLVETGKFTQIWISNDNMWKISRVISYDHQEIK